MADNQEIGPMIIGILQVIGDILFLLLKVIYSIVLSIVTCLIKQPKSVNGEIVLITGAGHGIGKELAFLYAAEGATVVIWDVNEENGKKTVAEINKKGNRKAYFFKCDVSKRQEVLNVAQQTRREVGDVTILVNNAGIMPTHPLLQHSSEEIERIMNINVMAHFWTLEAFLPTMKQNNHGHIVCLSSTAGMFGIPNLVPYCTSKFAVRGMMETLREELRMDRKCEIKLTSIYPYMINTGLCKKPIIKFENAMKMVEATDAAKEILYAQRHDITDLTIPRHFWCSNNLLRLFPRRAQWVIFDFLGAGLESDLS